MRIAMAVLALAALSSVGCASDHRRGGTLFPVGIYAQHLKSAYSEELGGVRSLAEHAAEGGFWEGQHYREHFARERGGGLGAIWGGTIGLFRSSQDRAALGAYRYHLR